MNKRIAVTPIALVGGRACRSPEDFIKVAETLDRAARDMGVNIGGYSAIVSKGMTPAENSSARSRPPLLRPNGSALVNVGSTKTGSTWMPSN